MKISLTGAKSGFTLMEMLIVIALFSLTMTMMAQTFASFNRMQRRVANRAVLSQELRYVTELMTRAVRNDPVVYDPAPLEKSDELRLRLPDGNDLLIRRSVVGDPNCGGAIAISCLLYSLDTGATWTTLTGARVNIDRFDVYVRPTTSPYEGLSPPNVQPFVTFSIKMTYRAPSVSDEESLEAQTTVGSRVYLR